MKGGPVSLLSRLSVFLILACLPLGLLLFTYIWQYHNQPVEESRHQAVSLAANLANAQNAFIARTQRYLQHLAKISALKHPAEPACRRFLRQDAFVNGDYINIAVANPDGELVCSALPLPGRVSLVDHDFFQAALKERRFTIGTSRVDRVSKQNSVGFALPVIDPENGRVRAVVIATVSLESWSRRLATTAMPAGSVALLVDANQTIIAHYPSNARVIGLYAGTYGFDMQPLAQDADVTTRQAVDSDGEPRMHAYMPLGTPGEQPALVVALSLPLGDALALASDRLLNGVLMLSLAFLILFGLMISGLQGSVVQPLNRLLLYTRSLGRDGAAEEADIRGASEVRTLQSEITSMVETRLAAESDLQVSEARFRMIAETVQEVFWVVTPDWEQVLYVNPAYEQVWQRSVESLYRRPRSWISAVIQEDRQPLLDYIASLEGADYSNILFPLYRIERKDGTIRWISAKGFPAYDSEGRMTRVVGVAEDVTERKQYEAELTEREAKYRLLVEHAEDLVVKVDVDGKFLFISPSYCRTFGKSEHQLLGKAFMPLVHEDDRAATQEAMKGLYYPPFSVYIEQRAMTVRGWRWFGWSDTAILDDDGQVTEILGVGRDISRQKQVEHALRDSERRYRELVDSMSDGVAVYRRIGQSDDFLIEDFNHAAEKIAGFTKEQVIGQRVDEIFPGIGDMGLLEILRQVSREGRARRFPITAYEDQRLQIWVENYVYKLSSDEVVAVFRDVTAEHRAVDALKQSEEKFRGFFEDLSVGLVLADSQGLVQEANKAFARMFQVDREAISGTPLAVLLSVEPESEASQSLAELVNGERDRYRFQTTYRLPEEQQLTANIAVGSLNDEEHERTFLYAIVEDVTALESAQAERNKLQSELMRTYRLEALGRLTGGIAHDFNNILGAISGFIELAQSRMGSIEPEKIIGYLKKSQENAERAKQLIRQMLIFSRGPEDQTGRPRNFNEVIAKSLDMIRSLLPSSITIEVEQAEGPFQVVCDPVQVEQVLLNLCINARDAMDGKGVVQVTTGRFEAHGERCAICSGPVEGEWVSLQVRDSGKGISEDDIERIFEPFFTTKGRDQGTGLGLSVVHGIVSGYRGHILIESGPDQGTSFHILFPLYQAEVDASPKPISQGTDHETAASIAGARLLVVDDEESMRILFQEALSGEGCHVDLCSNGREAWERLQAGADGYDLLITDQTMPQMTGLELVRHLRESGNRMPVVLCSGYSESINDQAVERLNIDEYLEKPVNLVRLKQLLKRLLASSRSLS